MKDIRLMRKDDGFQNVMRRFLKGDENMVNDVISSLGHNSASDGKCNYITAQTGFTLRDLVSYDCKHNEENGENNTDGPDYNYSWNCGAEGQSRKRSVVNLRKSQIRNAFLLLLLAQGTPCLLSGDEFYNTQKGNNNVYCQDNATGWLDWSRLKSDRGLFDYVKALITFRKNHPCLCQKEPLKGMDRTACGMPDVSYHGENAWQVKTKCQAASWALCIQEQALETVIALSLIICTGFLIVMRFHLREKENAGIWRWIRTEAFCQRV